MNFPQPVSGIRSVTLARGVLLVFFFGLVVPSSRPHFSPDKSTYFKSLTEQVACLYDTGNRGTTQATFKETGFALKIISVYTRVATNAWAVQPEVLFVNFYERNVFYTFISINAP